MSAVCPETGEPRIERTTKYFHAGEFAARLDVDLIYDESGWSPCLSHEDVTKLDRVQ
jgi:hypothetical protein